MCALGNGHGGGGGDGDNASVLYLKANRPRNIT